MNDQTNQETVAEAVDPPAITILRDVAVDEEGKPLPAEDAPIAEGGVFVQDKADQGLV